MHFENFSNIPTLYPRDASSTHLTPSCDNQKNIQTLLNVPTRGGGLQNPPLIENYWYSDIFKSFLTVCLKTPGFSFLDTILLKSRDTSLYEQNTGNYG